MKTLYTVLIAVMLMTLLVICGAQGLYDAAQAGQSMITAHGDPTCLSEKPACAQPSIELSATVIVG